MCKTGVMREVPELSAKEKQESLTRRQAEESGETALRFIEEGDVGRAQMAAQMAARKAGEIVYTLKELLDIKREAKEGKRGS